MEYIGIAKDIIVWNQIRRVCDKIQVDASLPHFIKTVHGIGYSFDPRYKVA